MLEAIASAVGELFCNHEDVKAYDGKRVHLRCLHCGRETEGFSTEISLAETPNTGPYWAAILEEMEDAERELHPGG